MKKNRILPISFALLVLAGPLAFAQDEEGLIQKIFKIFRKKEVAAAKSVPKIADTPKKQPSDKPKETVEVGKGAVKTRKDLSPAELVEYIQGTLDGLEDIISLIPGLKREKAPEGKEFYSYQGVSIADLDKETLNKLFSRVRNEATRIRTEKLSEQMRAQEAVRNAQEIARQQQILANTQQAARASSVVTPPSQPPRIPQPPPNTTQPPKVHQAPPAPPRR